MERDTFIAYGLAQFQKERYNESSDRYNIWVCNTCGIIAQKVIARGNDDIHMCPLCKKTDTSMLYIPYAAKIFMQELQSIGIHIRLIPEKMA